jgi:hypothetical protein
MTHLQFLGSKVTALWPSKNRCRPTGPTFPPCPWSVSKAQKKTICDHCLHSVEMFDIFHWPHGWIHRACPRLNKQTSQSFQPQLLNQKLPGLWTEPVVTRHIYSKSVISCSHYPANCDFSPSKKQCQKHWARIEYDHLGGHVFFFLGMGLHWMAAWWIWCRVFPDPPSHLDSLTRLARLALW